MKRVVLILILIALLPNFLYLSVKPKIANAVIPVTDVAAIAELGTIIAELGVISGELGVISVSTTGETTQSLTEWGLKIAGQAIKRQFLDKLVQAIINWIQGGAKGKIIGDWEKFLKQAGQDAVSQMVGTAIENSDLKFLCSPFGFQVRFTLLPVQDFSSRERTGCTLETIEGNIDKFYEDFTNGGWISYQKHWQPRNNFYGATLLSWREADIVATDKQTAAQNEAMAGGGFLSSKKCDANGKNCVIVTPGKTIGDTVKTVLVDTPLDTLIGADDIAEYVGAIVNAAINKLTTSAIDKLIGVTNKY